MKAAVQTKYGPPSKVLKIMEVPKPSPKDDEVLVKVHASSICWADHAMVTGSPVMVRFTSGLFKPKHEILGIDVSGVVEAVGKDVKRFEPGDQVYGDLWDSNFGAYAEYKSAKEQSLAPKPSNLDYAEAASVAQYALVALQGLRGRVKQGDKVLINGASGGIGPFAVQVAKYYGTEVTGVCSTKHIEFVRSVGADHVIDYTKEDFTENSTKYDLILDIVANHSVSKYKRALTPTGTYVAVAFNAGALIQGGKQVVQLSHEPNVDDLLFMKQLIEEGTVKPVIAKRFPLGEIAEAFRYYKEENPAGKVVLTVDHKKMNE